MFKQTLLALVLLATPVVYAQGDSYPTLPEPVDYPISAGEARENLAMAVQKMKAENGMFQQVTWIITEQKDMPVSDAIAATESLTKGRFNIYLSADIDAKYLPHIMWHEWGHVSFHRLPTKLQRAYYQVFKNEKACVSEYACTSKTENFAEWSVYYHHYNEFEGLKRGHREIAKKAFEHQSFFRLYQNYIFPVTGAKYGG